MSLAHILILALTQGLTEFLPVSSSGHLALVAELSPLPDQGLLIDVAVHVGTLGAVTVYFRRDALAMLRGLGHICAGRRQTPEAALAGLMIAATLPVVIAGFALKAAGLAEALRSVAVIGWATLVFGALLYWADRKGGHSKKASDWSLRDALVMGAWQALALIPGASRSGATMTAARLLGYGRVEGARLAMLMSIPTIAASGILLAPEAAVDAQTAASAGLCVLASFLSGLAALWVMMRLLEKTGFLPFAIYRIALGCGLLAIAYS